MSPAPGAGPLQFRMRPLIAFLSDFGTRDHYAVVMKAVILGICPDANLIDITHEIPPHDVQAAALELAASYTYFPSGTIFVAVVDPGVGTRRRGIAADTGDYRFVAPDNGLLTGVLAASPPKKIVELTERRYARPTVSRTFEGRDRFAPAAAWLAKGIQMSALGRPVTDVTRLCIPAPVVEAQRIAGEILRVDRFGNLVSNITRHSVDHLPQTGTLEIVVGAAPIARLVATYADIAHGEAAALFGSTDTLEIAVEGGSAAAHLGLTRGAPIVISRG